MRKWINENENNRDNRTKKNQNFRKYETQNFRDPLQQENVCTRTCRREGNTAAGEEGERKTTWKNPYD